MARVPIRGRDLAQRPQQAGQMAQALMAHPPAQAPQAGALGAVPSIRSLVSGLGVGPGGQRQPSPVGAGPKGPQQPSVVTTQEGFNPYTGQRLGAGEYVGAAGTEAEHEGQTRIPPPGWWDPNNPNYERRSYYRDGAGNFVGIEAGFQGDAEHPYDTGRKGEMNTEYGRGGEGIVRMSQPGVPTWGPGDERPKPQLAASGSTGTAARAPGQLLAGLLGAAPRPGPANDPAALLAQASATGNIPRRDIAQGPFPPGPVQPFKPSRAPTRRRARKIRRSIPQTPQPR